MFRFIVVTISLLFYSAVSLASGELVVVTDTYKEVLTKKKTRIRGVGFTLIDSQNRLFVATNAHLTPSGNPQITLTRDLESPPFKILGASIDSEHDVALFEIEPEPSIQALFKIDDLRTVKLNDVTVLNQIRTEQVDFAGSKIILAHYLNSDNICISQERFSTVNILPEKFRKALGILPRDYTSLDDLFSMAPIKPGFSGSPIVTSDGHLGGIAKSYHRFFYEYRWASPAVLQRLHMNYERSKTKEISLAQWKMYEGFTFRSIGDFWELAPLTFPSGEGGISGDSGGIAGDGGGIAGDGGGIAGDGGGIAGDGGNSNTDVWKFLALGSVQWSKDGSKKIIMAVTGPCINRPGNCRYYPSFDVLRKIINSGQLSKYKFLKKKEIKVGSLPKLIGMKRKNKFSVQTLSSQVTVIPKGRSLQLGVSVLVSSYGQFGFKIAPDMFGPILRVISPNKKTTYTFDVESVFYDTLDQEKNLIRFREDNRDWEDWIQLPK
jgi:hypothetical protein